MVSQGQRPACGATMDFRSTRLTRKISVLFVGTSEQRGMVARQLLADQGYEVALEMPSFAKNTDGAAEQVHDVIALDSGHDDGELIIVSGSSRRGSRHVRIAGIEELPDAVRDLAGSDSAVAETATSVAELEQLVAGLPGVVFRCDIEQDGAIEFMNDRIKELCDYDCDRFVGRHGARLLTLVPADDRTRVIDAVASSARTGLPYSMEHRFRCRGGEQRWLWHRGCVYQGRTGHRLLESFVVDITERKTAEDELAFLAKHDALTGVANRTLFIEQVNKSMQRADRHGEMAACLFIDLDRFKSVNDSYGHAFGDELLQEIAERLKRCVRGNDMIGRLGGDEFTVLLDGIADPRDAAAAARKILEELDRPYRIQGRELHASASIGISCYPGDAADGDSLLGNADAAMYRVKSSGRRGYRFWSADMSAQAFENAAIANALEQALRGGELAVLYQPRVDLASGRIAAFEALARWESNDYGTLSPRRFVRLADEAGMAADFCGHVLASACCDAASMREPHAPRVSVNLSAAQFRSEQLFQCVEQSLLVSGLQPGRLEIEVSAATVMQDPSAAIRIFKRLKADGVQLALDGFGAGHFSFHLLKELPVDYLKLDRSFLRSVPEDDANVAMTEAVVDMARRMGFRVVAEGIESEAQGEFARRAGCVEGQGFLFGRPASHGENRERLEQSVH